MESVIVKLNSGETVKLHAQKFFLRYEGLFAIIRDSIGNETAFPANKIRKIEHDVL